MCQFNCSLFAFIFKAVAARWVDWRLNLADSKENKKIKAVQRETCYLSATVGPRLGFKLCCWMVYVANSITNQYTVGRGEAAVVGLCRVGRAFFIIYNCAAQTEHFRIGRERERKRAVCAATPLRLFPSMPAFVSLKYRSPKKETGPARLFSLLFFLYSCPPLWLFSF